MKVERLPFDQYQRYRLVADLVRRLDKLVEGPLRVLDVGGRTALLRAFLPKMRVELVDMEASEAEGLVLGDGTALPFATESFDVVCAFDTLEHVPVPRREAFVQEAWRVTKRWVLLAGPYDAPRVRRAERLLARFIKDKLGFQHRYLDEHLSHGLPSQTQVEEQLRSFGGEVLTVGHGNLDRWFALMTLELYLDDDPALRAMAESVYEFYNRSLYASDHATPVYRHVVIGAFGGAPLPELAGLLDAPVAPKESLAPFTELSQALIVFDGERAAWRAERIVFQTAVAALEQDLAGHREVSAFLHGEVQARKDVTRDLRADLKGHRAALKEERRGRKQAEKLGAAQAAELQELRTSLEAARRDLGVWEASFQELLMDLEGHRGSLVAVSSDRDELRVHAEVVTKDLEGHRLVLAELRAQLDSWEEAVSSLATELGLCRGERDSAQLTADALELDLLGQKAVVEELRAERAELEQHSLELTAESESSRAAAADLDGDLAGYRASLNELKVEHETALETVATFERDLDGHRASLSELLKERDSWAAMCAQLSDERSGWQDALAELTRERDAALEAHTVLESDLKEERGQVRELRKQHAALESQLQAELEKGAQGLAKLEAERDTALEASLVLEEDLDGHRGTLREVRAERDALLEAQTELRSDLAGHKATLAELTKLDAERGQVVSALEADLAGHRSSMATLKADLEGHKATLEEREGRLSELRQFRVEAQAERARLEARIRELEAPEDGDQEDGEDG